MLLSQHRRNRNLPNKSPKHLHPRINRDGIGEVAEVVRKIRGVTRTRTVVMVDKTKLAIEKVSYEILPATHGSDGTLFNFIIKTVIVYYL